MAAAQERKRPPGTPLDHPWIRIDNKSDEFATVIHIEYKEDLGDLIELTTAIKNLGLNVVRASVDALAGDDLAVYEFFVTDKNTSDKILKSEMLEEIRMSVAYSLIETHGDMGDKLLSSDVSIYADLDAPIGRPVPRNKDGIKTKVRVTRHATGTRSILRVRTWDRPGLLVDIVRALKDMSLNVVSAEIDTVGSEADDTFFVTYRGAALPPQMEVLCTNALQYHLGLHDTDSDHSY